MCTGKPEPTAQWNVGDAVLRETQRINSQYVDNEAILNIKECVREDAGIYELIVKNDIGSTSVPVKVFIFCFNKDTVYYVYVVMITD